MAKIVVRGTRSKEELGRMTLQSEISIDRNEEEEQDTIGIRDHDEGRALGQFLAGFPNTKYEVEPDSIIAFLIDRKAGTGKEINEIFPLHPTIIINLVTLNLEQITRTINYLAGEE